MNADEFRTELTLALLDHVDATLQPIEDDDGQACLGVSLATGERFFVTVQKMAGGPFPGTERKDD